MLEVTGSWKFSFQILAKSVNKPLSPQRFLSLSFFSFFVKMANSGFKIFHTVPAMFSVLLILLIMASVSHCIFVATKGVKHPLVTLFSSPDISVGKYLFDSFAH